LLLPDKSTLTAEDAEDAEEKPIQQNAMMKRKPAM